MDEAGGFFDGQTGASERHAFMVQLLEESTAAGSHQALATTAAQVRLRHAQSLMRLVGSTQSS